MISKILYEAEATAPINTVQQPGQNQINGLGGIEQFFKNNKINLNDTSNPTASIIKEWLSANCDMPQTPDISQLDDITDPDIKGTLDLLNTADKATLTKVLNEIESGKISQETLNAIQVQFNAALNSVDTSR